MSIETVRIKDLEEVSVNDIERMWIPVDSATPDSTNKVKLSAFAAYVGGISDGKYIPLAGSSSITGSLVPSVANAALGSGSHKWLSLFAGGVHASDLLAIPQAAPSDPDPLESYLYCNTSGNYAETPSGGVANIYDLTIRRGSVSAGTYNLGEQAADINLSSLFSGYATESWVSSNFNNYTLPTASSSTKGGIKVGSSLSISNEVLNVLSGSIASNNTGYVTGGDIYSYINAIMSSSMKNIGESSTPITNGGSETPTINGSAYTPNVNDVVFYNSKEFVWTSLSKWRELGDESSFALKTTSISAGTGLTGGGDLTAARTISLSQSTIDSLALADSALQSSDMKALTLKVGSITVASNYNALTARTYTITKANITDTIGSTTYAPYHADGYLPLSAGSTKPLTNDLYFTKTIYGADVQVGRIGSVIDGGIVTYFTNPSSGSGSGTGPGFAIINTPYERLLFWQGSTDDSLEIYHEGNLTKGVLTTLLESNNGYYVKKSGDTMTGTLNSQSIIPTSNTSYDLGSSVSKWNNIYTRALYAAVAKISDLLSIPTVAPASGSIVSGEAYLYSSTGSYAETPGGGVTDVYPLTITKNGSAWLSYNPGVQAESINLAIPTKVSDLTNDTGFITASSIPSTYAWSAITNTPTTLSGYGITDAKIETPSGTTNKKITLGSNNFTIYSWALASSKPSYAFSDLTAHPTTISGYGITDAKIANGVITLGSNSITPLTSFTETDPVFSASAAAGITSTNISNWNTAYGWGNHASQGYLKSSDHKALTLKVGSATIRSDYNALAAKTYTITAQNITDAIGSTTYAPYNANGYVPTTRKVNNKALSSDITLSLDDVADGSTRKLANYLPLAGGTMTGDIILTNGKFIRESSGNNAILGINSGSFIAGSPAHPAIIRTDASSITHRTPTANYTIWDSGNFTPANYLALTGGTMSNTNLVTNLNADLLDGKHASDILTGIEALKVTTESDATFTYRAVPSVAVGDSARVTKVKGKTIVWNQQVLATSKTVTVAGGGGNTASLTDGYNLGAGHKYYIRATQTAVSTINRNTFYFVDVNNTRQYESTASNYNTAAGTRSWYVTNTLSLPSQLRLWTDSPNTSITYDNIVCFDLTLMGLDTLTAAEFEALFPLDYYAYNTGELISNKTESIETVGFNIWDEELLFGYTINDTTGAIATTSNHIISKNQIPVLPNTLYNIYIAPYAGSSGYGVPIYCYDGNMNYLGRLVTTGASPTFTTLANCMYIRFRLLVNEYGTTYNHNICINLSDTIKNGTYEPYRKDNLPLNITKLKVDTTNLWDEQWEQGTLDTNGADYASTINIRNKGYIPVEGGKTYYVKGNIQVYEYGASKNYITRTFLNSGTITLNVNTCYLRWRSADNYTYTEGDIWINTPNKRPPLKLNQLLWIPTFTSFTQRSVTITNNNDGTFTLNGTADSSGSITTFRWSGFTVYGGRKYLTVLKRLSGTISVRPYLRLIPTNKGAGTGTYFGATIGTVSSANEGDPYMAFYVVSGTVFTNYKVMPMLIDLTAMYGAGFEPSTPDEFFELVGDSYIPYNTDREVPYFIYPKGMKGTGTVYDEVVGKKAIRRYGCIDLGDCNWSYSSNQFIATELVGLIKEPTATSEVPNIICEKYVPSSYGAFADKNIMVIFASSSLHGRVYVKDSAYTDSTSYFNSIPGTKLYYELAAPIEYDLETAVPELIECDVLGTQRRLPEDTASSVQAPFHCDFQYGANPGEIVSDSAYRYLPLAGGTVYGTLEASGELIIPDHAPYQPEPNKHYLYVNDNGNYYQS